MVKNGRFDKAMESLDGIKMRLGQIDEKLEYNFVKACLGIGKQGIDREPNFEDIEDEMGSFLQNNPKLLTTIELQLIEQFLQVVQQICDNIKNGSKV